MSLSRTPPTNLVVPPASSNDIDPTNVCPICSEVFTDSQECVIITQCAHFFHRLCIEAALSTTSECQVCKTPCQLSDLKRYHLGQIDIDRSEASVTIPNTNVVSAATTNSQHNRVGRGKPRGARSYYNTRSQSKGIFQDQIVPQFSITQDCLMYTPDRNSRPDNNIGCRTPIRNSSQMANNVNDNTAQAIDYGQINKMIEQNLTRLLCSLNLLPPAVTNSLPENSNLINNNSGNSANPNVNHQILSPLNSIHMSNGQDGTSSSNSSRNSFTSDKITSILLGWNLKFDGSPNGLNVEEFLYRLKSLTSDTFNGDLTIVCKNMQTLLSGKAKEWYWRYRKQVVSVEWKDFCEAIRSQYRDFKTSFDIREEIRNRKQKPGENFDAFYDAVSTIVDRLYSPMEEMELIEILTRNLRPEIRQELLYVPVHSISHLRKLVQKRENFLNDEHVRRNLLGRNNQNLAQRRQISEVEQIEKYDHMLETPDVDQSVNALQMNKTDFKCWNCDEVGHRWEDCLQDRQIFCYGCGAKGIYKPNCTKCINKKGYIPKNSRTFVPMTEQL